MVYKEREMEMEMERDGERGTISKRVRERHRKRFHWCLK
jgi:hypothetical protein